MSADAQKIALLDVDHTLWFNDKLNMNLINALKQQGIKEVYLFTDMMLKGSSIKGRNELIVELQKYGLEVKGVITPNDLYWPLIDTLSDEHVGQILNDNRGDITVQNVLDVIGDGDVEQGKLGEAFLKAAILFNASDTNEDGQFCNESQDLGITLTNRSVLAKALCDSASRQANFPHPKGLLLQEFCKNTTAQEIIICDDNDGVIASCLQVKQSQEDGKTIKVLQVDAQHGCSESTESYQQRLQHGTTTPPAMDAISSEIKYDSLPLLQNSATFFHRPLLTNKEKVGVGFALSGGALVAAAVLGSVLCLTGVLTLGLAPTLALGVAVAIGGMVAAAGLGMMFLGNKDKEDSLSLPSF